MLIPSIDLQNGSVVQLVQGEKLAIKAADAEPWIQKFSRFPRVQLIDLDAAMGKGDNAAIVAEICKRLPCRVGGGIRSIERARTVLEGGAHAVIASSALFRDGAVDVAFAASLAEAVGADRVIAAVDSKGGHVAIHGWKTILPVTAVDAVKALEPHCSEFLYTHVDTEGLLQGINMPAVLSVAAILAWYALFRNHTTIHGGFMVRLLAWVIGLGPACVLLAALPPTTPRAHGDR